MVSENMMGVKVRVLDLVLVLVALMVPKTMQLSMDHPMYGAIQRVNDQAQAFGTPIIGLILTSQYDEKQLLASGYFVPDPEDPVISIAGRNYNIGWFNNNMIAVYVLAGEPLAGVSVTVQIMLDKFRIGAIISTGSAASLVDELRIGDVAVVRAATYTSVWKWQPWKGKSVSMSSNMTLTFGDYNVPTAGDNELGSIDFKPVTRYNPFGGTKKGFWFPIPPIFNRISSQLVDVELESCYDGNKCLDEKPQVVLGLKGGSSDVVLLNKAYGNFLHQKGDVSLVDRQSAAVASTAFANGVPYAAFRGITNTLGKPSDKKMVALATKNSLKVAATFAQLIAGEIIAPFNHYSQA